MVVAVGVLLTLLATASISNAVMLDVVGGYILDVSTACTDGNTDATLTITSDLNVGYKVSCDKNNEATGELNIDTVVDTVSLMYDSSSGSNADGNCYFFYSDNTGVYSVDLTLWWSEPSNTASHVQHSVYTVTCTTGERKEVNSTDKAVVDGAFSPQVLLEHYADSMAEGVTLEVHDILGQPIANNDIAFGKKVRLVAESSVKIMALNCLASTSDGTIKYTILRSGCGDGLIFDKDVGFMTANNVSTSPLFNMFAMKGGASVQFSCTFVKCSGACDVSSCIIEDKKKKRRKRRSPDYDANRKPLDDMITLTTEPKTVDSKVPNKKSKKSNKAVIFYLDNDAEDMDEDVSSKIQTKKTPKIGEKKQKPKIDVDPKIKYVYIKPQVEDQHERPDKLNMFMYYAFFAVLFLALASLIVSIYSCLRQRDKCNCDPCHCSILAKKL